MYPPPYESRTKSGRPASQQMTRQRTKSRVGVLVCGTAAIAMVAGAAGAVALVDHSGATVPSAQPAPVGTGSPLAKTGPVSNQPSTAAPAGTVEQVSAKVLPSVVKIQITTGQGREEGSGIILSADGLILTNNHVVAAAAQGSQQPMASQAGPGGQFPGLPRGMFPGGQLPGQMDGPDAQDPSDGPSAGPSGQSAGGMKATVTFSDGRTVPFTVVGADPADDIAVVRAQNVSGLTPISIGSSQDLKVGQNVVAIGSPLGLQGTVTTGIISSLDRPVATGDDQTGQHSVMSAIQTDAAINPGNSGGALVDMNGNLIGVNSAIASLGGGQDSQGGSQAGSIGLGFAIPVDQAKRIADELISTGTVQHASLGVQLSSDDSNQGALVAGVADGSPAATAGVPKGAVITKVDSKLIDGPESLVAAIHSKAPGDNVAVTFNDPSGASHTVQVTLGQMQS
ncbi:serine protease [Mycolicibacterium sphagni]|uniref:Serine protease n=2 Tax=Mycolicibacterium sphagni TaxID=1786 RepID=A0A255DAZ1_9MYCO|nr:trypsin-like peptidase domain-containing protein [Mycolicibacterium sphagni]OYN76588.1 serine protease [Mycolicibacterium sphagni]